MKRKILWKRVLILVGGLVAFLLLLFVALFTFGRPLLSAIRASMWTVDPARSQQAARAMLDYQLPEGYTETKLLSVQGSNAAVLMTNRQRPGDMILLSSIPDGIRSNDTWRERYELGWSDDLDGHRYEVRTVEVREIQIGGGPIPLRLLEGVDESGRQVIQAVCILPGKTGDVLVAMMSSTDTWNPGMVEAFYQSIQK